ncbi:MAG: SUMF1/EgtB/PvdO family nonheme iron enzyme, partial [Rhodothermales bacterium]|nr:SUMF1/EgtB/PvdO family nonheme iron enzyme [Rhodothermales bacterium]
GRELIRSTFVRGEALAIPSAWSAPRSWGRGLASIVLRVALSALVLVSILAVPSLAQTGRDLAGGAGHPASGDGHAAGDLKSHRIPGTDVELSMAFIPAGTFVLGSPEDEPGRDADEGPQRVVSLEAFWMGTHEVTYDEFMVFRYRELDNDSTEAPNSTFRSDAVARPSPPYEDPAHGMGTTGFPAAGMTQWAALHYARWLSEKTGRFYRLPTEAEWEYACRAGSKTAYGFTEDSSELDAYAWYYGNSDEVFKPVGSKLPNDWGLYDMHGNVAEWTLDQYTAEFYSTLDDSVSAPWSEPIRLHPRTVRGGAYDDDPEALRCAARQRSNLNWKRRDPQIPKSYWWNTDSPFVGFRLVSPVSPPSAAGLEEFWTLVLGE